MHTSEPVEKFRRELAEFPFEGGKKLVVAGISELTEQLKSSKKVSANITMTLEIIQALLRKLNSINEVVLLLTLKVK